MADGIVVINSGSTTIKFAAYRHEDQSALELICRGMLDHGGSSPTFLAKDADGATIEARDWKSEQPPGADDAVAFAIDWLNAHFTDITFTAAGHRLVLGGEKYPGPVVVNDAVLADLDRLSVFQPSHQPYEIAGIRRLSKLAPRMPQVACFDTSFHQGRPKIAQIYALPRRYTEGNLRRWGYHGISFEYISQELPRYIANAPRVIAAHLGGGCSMCAMLDGRSVETSMGFSTIEGLPMATRAGGVDAGLLLHLLKTGQIDVDALGTLLYRQSGLLGLSGISGDLRALEASRASAAAEAIDYFTYQIVKFIGAYAAVLAGLDALVFTAGIGENSSLVRRKVCEGLGWLGVAIDPDANESNQRCISSEDSEVAVFVIPTDEELMIARHTVHLTGAANARGH